METLRLIETTAIQVSFSVPSASATFIISYEDLVTGDIYSSSAVSNSSKLVTFTLDDYYLTYAGHLSADIKSSASANLISVGIDVVKPYCDITELKGKLGLTTAQTIQCEKVARKMIEAEVGKFDLVRKEKEVIGRGIDYLPLDEKIQKLYYIWENDTLVFDYEDEELNEHKISVDKTSIVPSLEQNKLEYSRVWSDRFLDISFESGYDYRIDADFGYKVIPEDIQEACEILIQDIALNNMRYVNRYIESFDNTEFVVKFAKGYSSGTGNMIIDKILNKYKNRIIPGVL